MSEANKEEEDRHPSKRPKITTTSSPKTSLPSIQELQSTSVSSSPGTNTTSTPIIPSIGNLINSSNAPASFYPSWSPTSYAAPQMNRYRSYGPSDISNPNQLYTSLSPLDMRFYANYPANRYSADPTHNDIICLRCHLPIQPSQMIADVKGNPIHNSCALCATCGVALNGNSYFQQEEGGLVCQTCYMKATQAEPLGIMPNIIVNTNHKPQEPLNVMTSHSKTNFTANIVSQPAKYQIANYNINPAPALSLESNVTSSETISASLIESTSDMPVPGGFQSGDVRVFRGGSRMVYFTGLKLNKMAPIKADLSTRNIKVAETTFYVRFTIGDQFWCTESFKIVSSCSQLPPDIRHSVRPAKKASGRRKASEEDEEES